MRALHQYSLLDKAEEAGLVSTFRLCSRKTQPECEPSRLATRHFMAVGAFI
jgi:hypothetical protein